MSHGRSAYKVYQILEKNTWKLAEIQRISVPWQLHLYCFFIKKVTRLLLKVASVNARAVVQPPQTALEQSLTFESRSPFLLSIRVEAH